MNRNGPRRGRNLIVAAHRASKAITYPVEWTARQDSADVVHGGSRHRREAGVEAAVLVVGRR